MCRLTQQLSYCPNSQCLLPAKCAIEQGSTTLSLPLQVNAQRSVRPPPPPPATEPNTRAQFRLSLCLETHSDLQNFQIDLWISNLKVNSGFDSVQIRTAESEAYDNLNSGTASCRSVNAFNRCHTSFESFI